MKKGVIPHFLADEYRALDEGSTYPSSRILAPVQQAPNKSERHYQEGKGARLPSLRLGNNVLLAENQIVVRGRQIGMSDSTGDDCQRMAFESGLTDEVSSQAMSRHIDPRSLG